ncbi:MAG: hypothetical protein ACK4SJ_05930 [Sphingorhabdus sp.]
MTLLAGQIGDRGQTFVVQCWGWPDANKEDWQDCVFTDHYDRAEGAEELMKLNPSIAEVRIYDRKLGKVI